MKPPAEIHEPVDPGEMRAILSTHPSYTGLPDALYAELAAVARRVFYPAGARIYRIGETTPWISIVEYGRVASVMPSPGGPVRLEGGRGYPLLMGTGLAGQPSMNDIYALRDTKVIRIHRDELLACMSRHPELIVANQRNWIDAVLKAFGKRSPFTATLCFALLRPDDDPIFMEAARSLEQALTRVAGAGAMADSHGMAEHLGFAIDSAEGFERARPRIAALAERQEREARFSLLVCDPEPSPWNYWSADQADRILALLRPTDTHVIPRIDRYFADREIGGEPQLVDVVLVHEADTALPRHTAPWMELGSRRRHHHVRRGNESDFAHLARRISGRSVGVVLGGGGARGLAHIGVLQALEDAGIPADAICGTSMGSVMAAAYARGWSPREILERVAELFQDRRAVVDLDFPMVALLGGRKLDRVLRTLFEGIDIEDLWLPYFCISANLSRAQMTVHDRGPLWRAIRASCSLPGIFPPVREEDDLLVDGGIVNNVPMDVMRERYPRGRIVAVDVGGGGAKNLELGERDDLSGWGLLTNRLDPRQRNENVANIFQVLMWSTTLSSKRYLSQLRVSGDVDLFLSPPVQEFQLLGFDAWQRLFDAGYEHASKEIAAWQGREELAAS